MTDSSNPIGSPDMILVVDDERSLVDAISYSLRREGWRVETAVSGPEAIDKTRQLQPDLLILDVMLPGFDGIQVCRRIRTFDDVPIIFLSARSEDFDRILGLEIGGDDYLTKPFVMRELVARVRANLRRARSVSPVTELQGIQKSLEPGDAPGSESGKPPGPFQIGTVTVDTAGRTVVVGNRPVNLKPKEFDLLAYLIARPGIAVSRDTLLRDVWNSAVSIDTRTVDVHIRAIRRGIEQDPSSPKLLETVRGHGYRFRNPASPA